MKFRIRAPLPEGDTRDCVPVVHVGHDFYLTRQGALAMVAEVVGPNLEVFSTEQQLNVLGQWVEAILNTHDAQISHCVVSDAPRDNPSAEYFAARAAALMYANPALAYAAARRAEFLATVERHRYRSFMVCRRPLKRRPDDLGDAAFTKEVDLLRRALEGAIAGMAANGWAFTLITGSQLEDVVRDVFDPYGISQRGHSWQLLSPSHV